MKPFISAPYSFSGLNCPACVKSVRKLAQYLPARKWRSQISRKTESRYLNYSLNSVCLSAATVCLAGPYSCVQKLLALKFMFSARLDLKWNLPYNQVVYFFYNVAFSLIIVAVLWCCNNNREPMSSITVPAKKHFSSSHDKKITDNLTVSGSTGLTWLKILSSHISEWLV